MQLEVGGIYEGKVTGITKFGAFVSFEGGQTGMVHISEVAPTFVTEIRDFVTEGQTVKVKVLSINEEGKEGPARGPAAQARPPAGRPAQRGWSPPGWRSPRRTPGRLPAAPPAQAGAPARSRPARGFRVAVSPERHRYL